MYLAPIEVEIAFGRLKRKAGRTVVDNYFVCASNNLIIFFKIKAKAIVIRFDFNESTNSSPLTFSCHYFLQFFLNGVIFRFV